MIKLIFLSIALSVVSCALFTTIDAPTQIIKNLITYFNQLVGEYVNDIQNQLNNAGTDASRYVHNAALSGETSNLVKNIDNRYQRFSDYVDKSVDTLFTIKYESLQAAETHLSAYIPDEKQELKLRNAMTKLYNNAVTDRKIQINAYKSKIHKIMHSAAEAALKTINAAVENGTNDNGVAEATEIIQLAQVNSNKTLHNHLNIIGGQTQAEDKAYSNLVTPSETEFITQMWNALNSAIVEPATALIKKTFT